MVKQKTVKAFTKPTINEVETFMNIKKPEWPAVFARYYAERFWNHYQSNGWKVSGRAAMKDWKAAICAQWMILKFREDKEHLDACLRSVSHRVSMDARAREGAGMFAAQDTLGKVNPLDRALEKLDELMASWASGGASDSMLQSACTWLRTNKILRLPREQVDRIVNQMGNDGQYGKLLTMRQFFTNLQTDGLTVKSYFYKNFEPA